MRQTVNDAEAKAGLLLRSEHSMIAMLPFPPKHHFRRVPWVLLAAALAPSLQPAGARPNIVLPGFENNPALHLDLNMTAVEDWLGQVSRDQPFCLVVRDHSPHVVWPEKLRSTREPSNARRNCLPDSLRQPLSFVK